MVIIWKRVAVLVVVALVLALVVAAAASPIATCDAKEAVNGNNHADEENGEEEATEEVTHVTPFSTCRGGAIGPCYLNISAQQVMQGQWVEISSNVCNSGSRKDSRNVALMINGRAEQSQTVVVSPGSCQTVVFRTFRTVPGLYHVSVDGQVGYFAVMPFYAGYTVTEGPSPEAQGLGTAGVVTIVVVLVVLGVALYVILKK
jgi:hypothetical protein